MQSQKRIVEICKSYEEMNNRMRIKTWQKEPCLDWEVRLNALVRFVEGNTTRQIMNLAKINL